MESNEVIMTSGTSVSFDHSSVENQSNASGIEPTIFKTGQGEASQLEVAPETEHADALLEIAKTEGFEITFKKLSEGDFKVAENKAERYSYRNQPERLQDESEGKLESTDETTDVYGGGLAYGEEKLLDIRIQSLQETVEKLAKKNQELEEQLEEVGNEHEYIASFYLQRAKALEEIAQREKDEKKKGNWLSILVDIIANLMKMTMVEDKDLEKQKEAETIEKLTS